jgi:sugar/nucleoside kinase (ribokinase family)
MFILQVLSEPGVDGTTGSVIVLTTPDAHRTMLSCWGTSATLEYEDAMDDAVANAQVLVVEGYLWEMPETIASIRKAMATAKRNNVTVAFTASDASCVERHRDEFWELLKSGDVDIFFANRAEALAMTNLAVEHKEEAVRLLAKHAELVVMTDGSHGSYLVRDEQLALVPPHWSAMKPVDTCGAGDAFAAGCLYGLLMGEDLRNIGRMGARVASVVISHTGARLSLADAELLMSEPLFSSTVQPPAVRSNPSNPLCVVPKSKENPHDPATVDMENKLDFDRRA